jgi:2-dehydro-3-deoxy-D-arabinonate dehydratase
MRYYRRVDSGSRRIVARDGDRAYDLTSVHDDIESIADLLSAGKFTGTALDEVAASLLDRAESVDVESLEDGAARPVVPDEVWAAGVTYEISEQAREEESELPDVYRRVYENERPEIFFKSTANRTVGPAESIGVRGDSGWNVPEPELGVVIYEGSIVGYTIGNDVSSRELEGTNPLYLPQAKVYDRSCSIGPCLVSAGALSDPHDLDIEMSIHRNGDLVYDGTTNTAEMVRSCEELVDYYRRSNALPRMSVLLTGTSLVPPEDVSLREGDTVTISIESIGTLENPVVTV